MPSTLRRPVSHEDRMSLTEHLDELRTRIIVCVVTLIAAFGLTFWQNDRILEIVNKPLEQTQNLDGERRSQDPLEQNARFQLRTGDAFRAQAEAYQRQAAAYGALAAGAESPAERRAYTAAAELARQAQRSTAAAAEAVPSNRSRQPVTLGVAEPFTATVSIAFYAALLLALPVLLWQAYAFILPAFAPGERKIALPLMGMVPLLFAAGVLFGYLVVLPRAVGFLQNFNDDSFDILLQAREYYRFSVMFIGGIGVAFQVPIVVIAVTRLGIVTPRQLQQNWGYVLLGLAVLAAVLTPTPDPLTMLLAMAPLFLLFEASILLSAWLNRVSPPGSWWGEDDDGYATAYDDED
jgi:sec-independent protein translocase protein TatC